MAKGSVRKGGAFLYVVGMDEKKDIDEPVKGADVDNTDTKLKELAKVVGWIYEDIKDVRSFMKIAVIAGVLLSNCSMKSHVDKTKKIAEDIEKMESRMSNIEWILERHIDKK